MHHVFGGIPREGFLEGVNITKGKGFLKRGIKIGAKK